MKKVIAVIGGMAGAATVTFLHQVLKTVVPSVAPRLDLLGMEAIRKLGNRVHIPVSSDEKLYKQTFIGDMVANTLYYSLAGGNAADLKGTVLGIAAGIAAVQLPEKMHLTPAHSSRTKTTEYLTMGIYIAGGLAAAATVGSLTQLTHKKVKMPKIRPVKLRRKLHL